MFKVLGEGGAEYGPVNRATLRIWARKRRVQPETTLHEMDTGRRFPAYQMRSLQAIFSAQADPPPVLTAARRARHPLRGGGAWGVAAVIGLVFGFSGYSLLAAQIARGEKRAVPVLQTPREPAAALPLPTLSEPAPARVAPLPGVIPAGWPYADRIQGSVCAGTPDERAAGVVLARRYSTDWAKLARAPGAAEQARIEARQRRRGRVLDVPLGAGARIVDHKVVFPDYLYKVCFTSGPGEGRLAWIRHYSFRPQSAPGLVRAARLRP